MRQGEMTMEDEIAVFARQVAQLEVTLQHPGQNYDVSTEMKHLLWPSIGRITSHLWSVQGIYVPPMFRDSWNAFLSKAYGVVATLLNTPAAQQEARYWASLEAALAASPSRLESLPK